MALRMATVAAVALVAAMGMLAPRAAAQTPPTQTCAANLVPCGQYLNGTGTPPDTCCGPLKESVQNDLKCLCDLYASPEIFKSLKINITQALELSKRCGLADTAAACKGSSPFFYPSKQMLLLYVSDVIFQHPICSDHLEQLLKQASLAIEFVMFSGRFAKVGIS
ncbi:hypothetical protein BAE44_0016844 [Dichanthelium oligosanthes]|uniref:Bifunctional inhibitor/plant lipid transfer protein/seed storage helical domain-containing protein n=1 Tax=Dichanthelium oligosanthes TaxID=888268 RepID=A0A1E5VAF5_9POAL|nr:hypothetical protein BAE44_0016844 [Dichanthelium oligosanthes]